MGILSKIFKPFKKIVRKVGKAIKSVAKIIAKPLKAVLKPIGKVFGKLGPLGTIALNFILPGIGGALGSWFNAAGGAFQGLFAPGSFMHNAIGSIGSAIQGAAKFGKNMYDKTIGHVFNSVTEGLKSGLNHLTGGAVDRFQEWTGSFVDKLTYKGEGIQASNWEDYWKGPAQAATDNLEFAREARFESVTDAGNTGGINYDKEVEKIMGKYGDGKLSTKKIAERSFDLAKVSAQATGNTAQLDILNKVDIGEVTDVYKRNFKISDAYDKYKMAQDIYNTVSPPEAGQTRYPGQATANLDVHGRSSTFGFGTGAFSFNTQPFSQVKDFMSLLTDYAGVIGIGLNPNMTASTKFNLIRNAAPYGVELPDLIGGGN